MTHSLPPIVRLRFLVAALLFLGAGTFQVFAALYSSGNVTTALLMFLLTLWALLWFLGPSSLVGMTTHSRISRVAMAFIVASVVSFAWGLVKLLINLGVLEV